jgi:RNA polymerase primary sigma factor
VVIRLYFGLDQDKALTLQGIGDVLGLSRERIRQIKGRGLEKLRRIMEKKDL